MSDKKRTYGRGSVFQRPGCRTWTLQYYVEGFRKRKGQLVLDAAGRPVKARIRVREATGLTLRTQAQALLTQRMSTEGRGEWKPVEKHPDNVADLLEALQTWNQVNKPTVLRNTRKSARHLLPALGSMAAAILTPDHITSYAAQRQQQGAANATINRELATLRRAFRLAMRCDKLKTMPYVAMLQENNTRKTWVDDAGFKKLEKAAAATGELWLRLLLELAYTYGWRKGELLGLRVRHVDLRLGTIRLDPGTTKNGEGREVVMSSRVRALVHMAVTGKKADDYVLTRQGNKPVKSLRGDWWSLTVRAGLGEFVCRECGSTAPRRSQRCPCGLRKPRVYQGIILHDMRRSAAKALRRAGVPESVIMKIGGWQTPAMFRRYAIDSTDDKRQAVEALEKMRAAEDSPNLAPILADNTDRVQ